MKVFVRLLFFLSVPALAQDIFQPDSIKKTVEAREITNRLKVDGRLEEAEWRQARPVKLFKQIEPYQGQKASHDTEVRILYDRHFLYLAAFCRDSLGRRGLRVPNFRRDFEFPSQDGFGVAIDGFRDERNAMTFATNPYGTQRDLLSFDDQLYDVDWDGLWRVRTSRLDSGWVAEIAIPWQTLRYATATTGEQTWGINFFRNRRLTNEFSSWAPVPRAFGPLRMVYAGKLTGITPPPPSPNIRVQPYYLTSSSRYNGTDVGYDQQWTHKVGGEVKWALNPNTVLDLTVNTDFAQADADRQVNNVSRFSVFFPERRQFFLENASLFGAGLSSTDDLVGGDMRIQPFFSRRIGLDDNGNPLPIDAGARLVYRSLKRNYGGIVMRQRGVGASPAVNYLVGRYSENLGKQNRIGTLFTVKNSYATDSLSASTNAVGAVDAFFRLSQPLSLNMMAMASGSSGGRDRGFAGYAQFNYRSNSFVGWYTQAMVTRNFNPAVGFVSLSDVIATTPGFFLVNRGQWLPKFIRGFEPGMFAEVYHQASTGRLQQVQLSFNPVWFALQSGGFLGLFVNPAYQRLDEVFSPLDVNITPGIYRYLRYSVLAGSDPSRKVSYTLNYERGGYFDGQLNYLEVSLRASPIPHVSVGLNYESNAFVEVGEQRETKSVRLYSIESRLALNPRLQLIGFYQKNTAQDRDTWNIRLAWEFQPLSFLYLVYNQRGYNNTTLNPLTRPERQLEEHLIGKISYLKQF